MLKTCLAALAAAFFLAAPALAAEPDRSTLSYEDNVTINTACFGAHLRGGGDFGHCLADQLVGLKLHPAPDRTQLSPGRNRAIMQDCEYLRRVGVAEYNDCLTKEMSDAAPADDHADKDAPASNVGLAKALVEGDAAPAVKPAASVPLPRAVLPRRGDRIQKQTLAAAELYRRVERAVFVVGAARSIEDARARAITQGSAIAIAPHLLLTNCHVVRDRPVIVLLQDHVIYHATLAAEDEAADRCVLASDGPALQPVLGVRPFGDLAVGEHVYAIGAPRALERTLTEGLVSGLRPGEQRNLIQTSAPLSPGSSGGGLFDERGNLLGITTLASLPGSQNLNFAIAASDYWN